MPRFVWSICFLLLCGLMAFAVPTFAYDGQNRTTVAYDSSGESSLGYDGVFALTKGEKKNGTTGNRVPFAKVAQFLAAETGAARLGSLTPAQARQIQAFSERFGAEVNVVGSRAAGTAGPLSDFDYVIGGNASLRNSAGYYLPRGAAGGELRGGLESGIDIFNANRTPLDPTRPFIQFTPGQSPVVGPR